MAVGMKYTVPIALCLAPLLLWVSRVIKLPLLALERLAGVVPERGLTAAAGDGDRNPGTDGDRPHAKA